MKFSWKVLNFFINLESIKFSTFIKKLNLSGLEIEKIEDSSTFTDKIIDLNITANRKEIFCIINLATEISTIFNLPLNVRLKPVKFIEPYIFYQSFSCLSFIYIKTHKIHKFVNTLSPLWLKSYLQKCDIKSSSLIQDIQQYIYIKWGHKFYIFDLEKLQITNSNLNLKKINNDLIENINQLIYHKQDHLYFDYHQNYTYKQDIIIYFITYPINQYNLQNNHSTFMQAYDETIYLITTYCKTIVGKSQEYYCNSISKLTHLRNLSIKKNQIKSLLGPTQNEKNYFLSNKQILNILKQLNYLPKYLHNYKIFKIDIPNYRKHDLKRNVDIIEEIGRIYGFEHFLDKLPQYQNKGNISSQYIQIKKIKNALYSLGFYEAITSSFVKEITEESNNIQICNPITIEQKNLRTNITQNLIDIYKQNLKNKNTHTEIFEIGTIFYKNNFGHFISENHIGGLISNNQYLQIDWSNTGKNINWFHAKGILENFLEIIQVNANWQSSYHFKNSTQFKQIKKYCHPNKKLFIYDINNKDIIGVFGEIYSKNINYFNIKNTYLFEINLNKLLKSIDYNKQYNYIMKPYSLYPSVTRDVSLKIKNKTNIDKIKKLFLEQSTNLTESIQIINDYYDIKRKQRSICIRIVYRSYTKTLNNIDLENIDLNIQNILNKLYNKNTNNMKITK